MDLSGLLRQKFWELIFPVQDPQAGETPIWGSEPLLLGENLCKVILPFLGPLPLGVGLDSSRLCPSYQSCCGPFFMSLLMEGHSW